MTDKTKRGVEAKRELTMTISLDAIEHLGMNLYSNVPAVLSEVVANAWDADATEVEIVIDSQTGTIAIQDNGTGMNRDGVIDRYLVVGFMRRTCMAPTTAGGRPPMGRKGIGKLSIFSIATTVQIYTASGGQVTAFRMNRDDIRTATGGSAGGYKPAEISTIPKDFSQGTRIVLSDLTKKVSGMTVEGLKRRIARRFSVIGAKFEFNVKVNGQAIGPDDRDYYKSIEYLWTYGDQSDVVASCTNLIRAESRLAAIQSDLDRAAINLVGWIGTVRNPRQLKNADGDNLNRIAVFMRGKLAQEDVLGEFAQKEIYADYVLGELHCDELDVDARQDIATSSRQTLKEDDPRFESLKVIVLAELRHVASQWSDLRRAAGTKLAADVPAVAEWLNSLQGDVKSKAERWIGRLNTIRSPDDAVKRELLKASILAFESYRRKELLDKLEAIEDESVDAILAVFESLDDLELSYYGQIVKNRVKVIETLQRKLGEDEKEQVLRNYIFQHLWLLDPAWERTKGSEYAETLVNKFLQADTDELKGAERQARIDIGYRTTAGKHVIVESKRASVATPVDQLMAQIRKYRDGAKRILEKTTFKDWPIEVVCLLGKAPPEWEDASGTGKQGVIKTLESVGARIVFYDELLTNAQQAYGDYLMEHEKIDKLWAVFEAIDDFGGPET